MAAGLRATKQELDTPKLGSPGWTGLRQKGGIASDPRAVVKDRRKLPKAHQAGNETHVVVALPRMTRSDACFVRKLE